MGGCCWAMDVDERRRKSKEAVQNQWPGGGYGVFS
jgi:hypothetical protein